MNLSDFLANITLTEWQESQIHGLPMEGVRCLLEGWSHPRMEGFYCNATWDEISCWPTTAGGSTADLPCSYVMKSESRFDPANLDGQAHRICLETGAWNSRNWTDYTECENSLEENLGILRRRAKPAKYIVRYILFYGSIASVLCLSASLLVFFYFKSIRCQRIRIHINMMLALLMKSLIMIVMVNPSMFKGSPNYKEVDWVCKVVISLQFYATVAAINWMFVQGHYLNSKLTNIFAKKFPFKCYLFIGWGIPSGIIGIWSVTTETIYGTKCWKDFSKLPTIWILVVSLSVVLMVNLLLLLNILRVVISSAKPKETLTRNMVGNRIKRGTKATALLFPLLGMTNLIFFYNPGGEGQKYYMVFQACLHSIQGILASVLYCFICKDVRDAMKKKYYKLRRGQSGNGLTRRSHMAVSFSTRDTKVSTRLTRRELVVLNSLDTVEE